MSQKHSKFASSEQLKIIIEAHRQGKKHFEILNSLGMQDTADNRIWIKSQIVKLIRQKILTRRFVTREEIKRLVYTPANSEKQSSVIESKSPAIKALGKKAEDPVSKESANDPSASGCRPGWRRYGFVMEIATRKRFEEYAKQQGYEYGPLCTAILKHFLDHPFKVDIE